MNGFRCAAGEYAGHKVGRRLRSQNAYMSDGGMRRNGLEGGQIDIQFPKQQPRVGLSGRERTVDVSKSLYNQPRAPSDGQFRQTDGRAGREAPL